MFANLLIKSVFLIKLIHVKKFLYILAAIVSLLAIIYVAGPKPSTPKYAKNLPTIPELSALPTYIKSQEAKHKIKPGNEAEIVWADSTKLAGVFSLGGLLLLHVQSTRSLAGQRWDPRRRKRGT